MYPTAVLDILPSDISTTGYFVKGTFCRLRYYLSIRYFAYGTFLAAKCQTIAAKCHVGKLSYQLKFPSVKYPVGEMPNVDIISRWQNILQQDITSPSDCNPIIHKNLPAIKMFGYHADSDWCYNYSNISLCATLQEYLILNSWCYLIITQAYCYINQLS